jgi:uncharacterized membrane protein YoaK (UPF0700 family)
MAMEATSQTGRREPEPDSGALLALLTALTVTTGLVDAVSVLGLGRVFTANMTGNVVFLGFALAGIPGFSALRSLASVGAFLLGALLGGGLATRLGRTRSRWLLTVAFVEAGLFVAAAVTCGPYDYTYDYDRMVAVGRLYALIGLTALAMGLRTATVRRLGVLDLSTTVLTLTLAGLGADSSVAGGANTRWGRRLASVLAMLLGAAVGAVLVRRHGLVVPLVLSGAITLVATIAYTRHTGSQADGAPSRL